MDYKVLITRKIPEAGLKKLKSKTKVYMHSGDFPISQREMFKFAPEIDAMISVGTQVDEDFVNMATRLKIISNYGVGYDNINIKAASQNGILVTNLPFSVTQSTAELAMALILSISRRIVEADHFIRNDNDGNWHPMLLMGNELHGKILGIIGFGRIGQAAAKIARSFGMKIIYNKRTPLSLEEENNLKAKFHKLESLLQKADYVVISAPLTDSTFHLIGEKELTIMKENAFLINIGRGPIVNEFDLVKALKNGEIAGAGLDVFEDEPKVHPGLLKQKNVVLTPHIGTQTLETRIKMAKKASDNILKVLQGKEPENVVNKKE